MIPVLDLHTHTIASGHAFSTLQEMVAAAAEKGLQYLGITEHGPAVEESCGMILFRNYRVVPRMIDGVRLLMGVEMNILDYEGSLDVEERYYGLFDHVIAGIHGRSFRPGTMLQNTDAIIGAMNNSRVNIISHPCDGTADVDLEALVRESVSSRTLLEVNNSSLHAARHRTKAGPNNMELLRLCRKYDVPVILGSDAHISYDIALYPYLIPLLDEVGFPEELIVNNSFSAFERFTGVKWSDNSYGEI